MREDRGNLWDLGAGADAVVITTNGFVKSNGAAVMGRGCAQEARDRWPGLDAHLGAYLTTHGNRPFRFRLDGFAPDLVTLPVKPDVGPNGEPGWRCEADLHLIERSCALLVEMADKFGWQHVVLPRPGCGNGRLRWEAVRPRLEAILDDRFTAVTF